MKGNKIPEAEYRAEKIKTLEEKRGSLIAEMEQLIGNAKSEVRAFSEDESKRISEIEKEIEGLNATIEAERRAETVKAGINAKKQEERSEPEQRAEEIVQPQKTNITEAEKRAFLSFIQSGGHIPAETRAGEQNITMGNNGAIIPVSIANQIINKVNEICPIMNGSTRYAVKGQLNVPVWGDADGHNITVGYHEEFNELTADAGKFTSVELKGHLIGSLVIIGQSVINNSQIDITSFIISEIAKKIAQFDDCELLTGTEKIQGALNTKTVFTTNSPTNITSDDLIDLQSMIPSVYQANACWTMHPDTFTRIRKLKDIGIEMCEPACIKYTQGATFTCSDPATARKNCETAYNSAVELFAYLCKKFGFAPLADGVIVSHCEGHKRGIASNHGDPEHLWNGLEMAYTMDGFRKDVAAAMGKDSPALDDKFYVQVGAFSSEENARAYLETVKKDYPDAFIKRF